MKKLSRITLGNVSDITNVLSAYFMGKGLIKTSRWYGDLIRIEYPKETKLLYESGAWDMKGKGFLRQVNAFLSDSSLFLCEARYREMSCGGFWPHMLTGQFYQERKK